MFRHVEILRSLGFDASVFSPKGRPLWMTTDAPLFEAGEPYASADNIVVFPEPLNGKLGRLACAEMEATKALLCQNQYSIFNETFPQHGFEELRFRRLITVSEIARGFLERTFAPAKFDVIPVWLDEKIFYPRRKSMRIAAAPRKLPVQLRLIQQIFHQKYPDLREVPWDWIHDRSEAETAEILGSASVYLSMSDRESLGLTPLEAMASGCVVVGFHGYGGQEYATDANGIWLRPDHLEETADAVAKVVYAIEANENWIEEARTAGFATARRFDKQAAAQALGEVFGNLVR